MEIDEKVDASYRGNPGEADIAENNALVDLHWAKIGLVAHGEVMGCDSVGRVITWDIEIQNAVFNGLRLGDESLSDLSFTEKDRLERDGYRFGLILPPAESLAPSPAP